MSPSIGEDGSGRAADFLPPRLAALRGLLSDKEVWEGRVEGEFVATNGGHREVAQCVVFKLSQKAVNMHVNVALVCHWCSLNMLLYVSV